MYAAFLPALQFKLQRTILLKISVPYSSTPVVEAFFLRGSLAQRGSGDGAA